MSPPTGPDPYLHLQPLILDLCLRKRDRPQTRAPIGGPGRPHHNDPHGSTLSPSFLRGQDNVPYQQIPF